MGLPNEVLRDVLAFHDRKQLERLQMVGRRYRDLIRRYFPEFPKNRLVVCSFSIEVYPSGRYCCELESYEPDVDYFTSVGASGSFTGPFERFSEFLRRRDIPPIQRLRFSVEAEETGTVSNYEYWDVWGDEKLKKYRSVPFNAKFTPELAAELQRLRSVFIRATGRCISVTVNGSISEINVQFLKCSLTLLDVPDSSENNGTSVRVSIERGVNMYRLIRLDDELAELLGRYDNSELYLDRPPSRIRDHDNVLGLLTKMLAARWEKPPFGRVTIQSPSRTNDKWISNAFERLRSVYPHLSCVRDNYILKIHIYSETMSVRI